MRCFLKNWQNLLSEMSETTFGSIQIFWTLLIVKIGASLWRCADYQHHSCFPLHHWPSTAAALVSHSVSLLSSLKHHCLIDYHGVIIIIVNGCRPNEGLACANDMAAYVPSHRRKVRRMSRRGTTLTRQGDGNVSSVHSLAWNDSHSWQCFSLSFFFLAQCHSLCCRRGLRRVHGVWIM